MLLKIAGNWFIYNQCCPSPVFGVKCLVVWLLLDIHCGVYVVIPNVLVNVEVNVTLNP
jgi:hypothetical protein